MNKNTFFIGGFITFLLLIFPDVYADNSDKALDMKNCLCHCLEPRGGLLTCRYDTTTKGDSPSCRNLSNGPCMCSNYGCFRKPLPTAGACYSKCVTNTGVTPSPPTSPPSHPPKKLEDIQEFRDFRGLDDRRCSREHWKEWVKKIVARMILTVKMYPGIHNRINVPPEKTLPDGIHQFLRGYFGYLGKGDLAQLLAMDKLPSENRNTNVYAALTQATENKLRKKILDSEDDSIFPEDLMKMALDACDGSYPMAVLTAHAILKEAAKKGRSEGLQKMFMCRRTEKEQGAHHFSQILRPHANIAKKLRNLRPAGDKTGDKLGPWYHGFGILSVGAFSSKRDAYYGAYGEHLHKWINSYKDAEGAYNEEKEYIDLTFADAGYGLEEFNRFNKSAEASTIEESPNNEYSNQFQTVVPLDPEPSSTDFVEQN